MVARERHAVWFNQESWPFGSVWKSVSTRVYVVTPYNPCMPFLDRTLTGEHLGVLALPVAEFLALRHDTTCESDDLDCSVQLPRRLGQAVTHPASQCMHAPSGRSL